jgi:hypothetical protein
MTSPSCGRSRSIAARKRASMHSSLPTPAAGSKTAAKFGVNKSTVQAAALAASTTKGLPIRCRRLPYAQTARLIMLRSNSAKAPVT